MSRRIELELTSARSDGTWTWRAAGAREPRGTVDGSLLPAAAKVGDVLRADVEMDLDGIAVTAVLPPKATRKEPERLELVHNGPDFEPVTQTLVAKRDRERRERRDDADGERRPRRDGDAHRRPADRRDRSDRPADGRDPTARPRRDRPPRGDRSERPDRPARPPRPVTPELPVRPKPKRLRPVRTHRNALLTELPVEQRPIAEQVLRGGIPAVRQALEDQNAQLRAEGKPDIPSTNVVTLAEDLLPKVRVAEWLDRAEGALNDLDELDLRDLRSVVVSSDDPAVARDESTRDMAARLKDGLANRQDKEHQDWLADIAAALAVGRAVRALRLSSRPPKAGVRFPAELGTQLTQAAAASLTAEASSDRWVAVLEALAYSPVHGAAVPASVPATVTDELKGTVTRLAGLLPQIATLFGVEPPPPGARAPRAPRTGRRPPPKPPRPPMPAASQPVASEPAPSEAPAISTEPVASEPVASEPAPSEPPALSTEPVASEPVASEPAPSEPPALSTEPAPSEPAPSEGAPSAPVAGEPAPIEPAAASAEPVASEPVASEPAPSEPPATSTEPVASEPAPSQPPAASAAAPEPARDEAEPAAAAPAPE